MLYSGNLSGTPEWAGAVVFEDRGQVRYGTRREGEL